MNSGSITPGMTKTALGAPAQAMRAQGAGSLNYAADYVMDVLDDFVGTVEGDIVVETTIDPALQVAAERASSTSSTQGPALQRHPGRARRDRAGRAVRALVGGRDYAASQFNRAPSPSASRARPSSPSSIWPRSSTA